MGYIIYFDAAAICILAVIVFSVFFRKIYKAVTGRFYLALVAATMVTSFFDILSIGNYNQYALSVFNMIYLETQVAVSLFYFLYLISITGTWNVMKRKWYLMALFLAPSVIIYLMAASNPLHHMMFTITWNDSLSRYVYARGPLLYANYGITAFYFVISAIYMFHYRKLVSREKLISAYSVIPLVTSAVIVQYFNEKILLQMFAATLSELLLSVTSERPETMIDIETGLRKSYAFADDSRKAAMVQEDDVIVLINVINLPTLRKNTTYSEHRNLKKAIAETIQKDIAMFKVRNACYYMGQGEYIAALFTDDMDKVEAITLLIRDELNTRAEMHEGIFELNTNVTYIRVPQDMSSDADFMKFAEMYAEQTTMIPKVLPFSEIKNKKDYLLYSEMDTIIEDALKNHKFEVYYQPIYSVKERRITSCEALLRLKTEKFGFINPETIIQRAEKNGSIMRIGNYIFEEVCRFISSGEFAKLGVSYVEVNLSLMQCMQEHLTETLVSIMNKYGVDVSKINLEITETADAYAYQAMLDTIKKLREAGFELSLDDYGTGYSNIEKVASLPLSIIKIDKSFVFSINNPKMKAALEYTIKMIKSMGYEIVVEGIENEEMLETFKKYGVEYIQGYYFSKPVPTDMFIAYVTEKNRDTHLELDV